MYYKKDGDTNYQNYAYGLFDNIEDMTISLIEGHKYKFECSMVREDVDTLYHDNEIYYAPFNRLGTLNSKYSGIALENKFNISTTNPVCFGGLKIGTMSTSGYYDNYNCRSYYPKSDRFYGELTDYIPTKDGVANIDLKRTAFGLKFIVTPPVDGKLYINSITINNESNSINSNVEVSAGENVLETSFMCTFYEVYKCWQAEDYTKDLTMQLKWGDGLMEQLKHLVKTITVKRNVMTTVNVKKCEWQYYRFFFRS
ncbi:MAG: hypothetical protein ACLVEU_07385 [Bacteroides cellulosilyticus]